MDKFAADRGLKLHAMPGIFIAPIALYSNKIKDVKRSRRATESLFQMILPMAEGRFNCWLLPAYLSSKTT